ncbi:unnamed protein product [Mycena citricolor]|uniref:EGF-like domain-containing protein n=1 Tax=Mycena citricolor TaxID=2018698 RepID=A0AAD2Q0Z2_9AGAR|nr:unnamed protein product [Mycena citricolor]
MFSRLCLTLMLSAWGARAASSSFNSSTAIVCVAGQCLQGTSNTSLGVSVSASDVNQSVILLPGQYTATTNPQLVHDLLTSPHASLIPSPGFGLNSTSSLSLPLNVAVSPGLSIYSDSLYSGKAAFSVLPSAPVGNVSVPLAAQSLAMSSSVWAAVSLGSNGRVVFWDSIPDTAQLPITSTSSMALLDMQSSTCSTPCASSGTCSSSGTCVCAPGFNGTSCETCAPGFFGPTCQACPAGCAVCDQGITGSGRCLSPPFKSPLTTCNCLNGECASDGTCACNPGWATASNGTACAKCAPGFFATSNGDCKVCQLGCTTCADGTGNCITCGSKYTQDQNDATKCTTLPSTANGVTCPDGSFGNGATCSACSASCATCTGPTSNDCTTCTSSHYLTNNGSCVTASNTGVCEGSNLIADNNKGECDTCGAKCTTCEISTFNVASTVNQLKCTGCLTGSVLSNGQCIDSCPSATFLSPRDNVTCTACDSSCSTCAGSPTTCLTCANNQLAVNGKCVSTCPSNTFSSSGVCLDCHPDCATCSGGSFSQCLSCPSDRPVLSNGRCLPTCNKNQFFETSSSSCQSCDASCSSCSGSGASQCLACASSSQVLRAGTCVSAACTNSTSVIPGLGLCLSDLVVVTEVAAKNTTISQPTKPTTPTPPPANTTTVVKRPLAWWEILLMALGCAFIFVLVMMCFRRRARNRRAKRTAAFATSKKLNPATNWRWRLLRFGEKLFGHRASRRAVVPQAVAPEFESEAIKLMKIRNAEEARHHMEMEKLELFGAYEYSRAGSLHSRAGSIHSRSSTTPSVLPPLNGGKRIAPDNMTRSSIYSQVTGIPRNAPEPRQPINKLDRYPSSAGSYMFRSEDARLVDVDPPSGRLTPAQAYADNFRRPSPPPSSRGGYWLEPVKTGTSSNNNPFRR